MKKTSELPLFVLWEKLASDLLERTQRFPKAVRFTFSTRIDNLALDILERIAEAGYSAMPRKRELLVDADRRLLRLRIVLRMAFRRQILDSGAYEHVMRGIDEAGRMLGGWLQEVDRR